MLESIRSSAQSFGVKLAFGVIILVFVFWGIGNFNDRDYSNVVAMVNGEPILAIEFEKAYQNAEEYILRNNPGMTREQLVKDHLGRQVLREMIQAVLMRQEARRAGIQVTPMEMRQTVAGMKVFQDEQGKFDPEAYKRMLAARRVSAAQYEKELADQLTLDKLFTLITTPVWIAPGEALNRYNYLRERREIGYIFVPDSRFVDDSPIPEKEIQEWYDAHKESFAIPARVDVSFIEASPLLLGNPKAMPETSVREWYEAHKGDYETPEQVRAAHILVQVAEDASAEVVEAAKKTLDQAQADLAAGKPFAEVADAVNGEGAAGPGGELGWIARGQTVEPFEEAAFNAEIGKVAGPVRSPFGWHLILVEEKREAGVKPFSEVEEEARNALAVEAGHDKMQDVLDNLIEDNILLKPMAESAAKYGLKVERTGLMDSDALAKRLGVKPEVAATLLATSAGAPLDTAFEAGDSYLIVRIEQAEPAGIQPLEKVRGEIESSIRGRNAQEAAMKDAAARLEKLRAGSEPASGLTSVVVERGSIVPNFDPDPTLNAAIFETSPGEWLSRPYSVQAGQAKGALIARVDKKLAPDAGEYERVSELLTNAARQDRKDAVYAMVLQRLGDKAKIEIMNQTLVDRGQN